MKEIRIQNINHKINYNKIKSANCAKSTAFKGLPNEVAISTVKDFQGRKPFSIIEKIEIGLKKLLGFYSINVKGAYTVKKFLEPYYLTADDIIIPSEVTVKGNYRATNSIELHGKVAKKSKLTSDKAFYINALSVMAGDAYGKYFCVSSFAKIPGTINASKKVSIYGDILETGEVNAPIVALNHNAMNKGTINATEKLELNRSKLKYDEYIKMITPKVYGKVNTPNVVESCL